MKMFSKLTDQIAAKFRKPALSGLQGRQSERNLWVSGYPISGNSYIAYVIAYVLNCNYFDVDSPEWSPQRVPLKKYLCGENEHPKTQAFGSVLKTHAPPSSIPNSDNDTLIYVVRDVRDVSNSYFHRVEKVWAASPALKHKIVSRLSKLVPTRLRYRMGIRYFSRLWSAQVNEVLEKPDIPVLRYEYFLKNPLQALEQIIKSIDPESWDEKIGREALEIFSLKNMKAAAAKSVSNPANRTDRVGGSGDYQNYFSPSDVEWFEHQYNETILKIQQRAEFESSNS